MMFDLMRGSCSGRSLSTTWAPDAAAPRPPIPVPLPSSTTLLPTSDASAARYACSARPESQMREPDSMVVATPSRICSSGGVATRLAGAVAMIAARTAETTTTIGSILEKIQFAARLG